MIEFLIICIALVASYIYGTYHEKKHFQQLRENEQSLSYIPIFSESTVSEDIKSAEFVSSSIVFAGDYFKHFWASLRNLFGGSVTAYESLLERARREALIRLKRKAAQHNADGIINVRITTSIISSRMVEIIAYGTVITIDK